MSREIYYKDGKWRLQNGPRSYVDEIVDPLPGDRISGATEKGWRMSLYCHELTTINNNLVAKVEEYKVKVTNVGENVFVEISGNDGLYINSVSVETLAHNADNEQKAGFNADISSPFVDLLSYVVNRFGYAKK